MLTMDNKANTSSHWSGTSMLYKAFYFVFYAGYISFLLYIPVYLKYLGLSAIHVGLLNGIRPLMQTIGAPLWGILGDRYRIRRTIFVTAFVVMTVKTMLFLLFRPKNETCIATHYNTSTHELKNISYIIQHDITKRSSVHNAMLVNKMSANVIKRANVDRTGRTVNTIRVEGQHIEKNRSLRKPINEGGADIENIVKRDSFVKYTTVVDKDEIMNIFIAILLLIIFGEIFDAAVFTLADTSCLDTLGSENYGYYRLWGSAGWGIMTPIIGFIISYFATEKCGVSVGAYFCIFYFYLSFMYLALLFGSHFEFNYKRNDQVNTTVKSALLNFHYGMFLFVTFYAGFCYGFLLYFVNLFIDSLGGSAFVMGTATACKSIVDVTLFFLSGTIIGTLGHLNAVTVSLIAYITAFVSYSYITNPWFAVPIEVLHSGAYALVWSSSVSYLNKAAPAGSSATVQGILQGVYWGLGTGGGTIIGGYVIHIFGFTSTFRAFAVTTSIILVVFLMTQLMSKFSSIVEDDAKSVLSSSHEDVGQSEDENDGSIYLFPELDDQSGHNDQGKNWENAQDQDVQSSDIPPEK